MLRKIMSVLCVLMGIAVIVLGLTFDDKATSHAPDDKSFRYSANDYDLDYASFGADFYTYIYKGSDKIVDILNEINKSTETVVKAESSLYEAALANVVATDALSKTIGKVGKTVTLSIGLLILAFGLFSVGSAFEKAEPIKAVIPQTVQPQSFSDEKDTIESEQE